MRCSFCASIKFCGIVVQIQMSEFERFCLTDGAFADQFGECGGQSSARGMRSDPEAFFSAEGVVEGKSVGAEHHFVRINGEKLLEDFLELRRIEDFGLQGSVKIDVFYGGEKSGFAFVGPAAMQEDEIDVFVAGIAQNVLEIQNVALATAE